ncbi:MAG TPA: hypothetical protein VGQ83_00170 [Polyangia bacterium]|jgi:hypothetical protein
MGAARLALCACLTVAALPQAAADPPAPARRPVILLVRESPAAPALVQAVEAQLADVAVSLLVERVRAVPPLLADQVARAQETALRRGAVAVFWLDAVPGQVLTFTPEAGGGRVLVRLVPAIDPAERVEAMAAIIRGFVTAALAAPPRAGAQVPEPRREPAPPPEAGRAVAPPVAGRPQPRPRLAVAAAWAVEAAASPAAAAHGLHLELAARPWARTWVFAATRLGGALAATAPDLTLRVSRHPVELGLRWEAARGRSWTLSASGAAVLDWITRDVQATGGALTVTPGSTRLVPALGAGLHGTLALHRGLALFVDAGAQVLLERVEYAATVAGASAVILSLSRVRPRLLLGLAVTR